MQGRDFGSPGGREITLRLRDKGVLKLRLERMEELDVLPSIVYPALSGLILCDSDTDRRLEVVVIH